MERAASVPWPVAWHNALYAAELGFYVARGGPAAHFTTATHGVTGSVLADALLRLWHRSHDEPPAVVVDVGAGRGELATHLLRRVGTSSRPSASHTPPEGGNVCPLDVRVVAVDVVERPDGLDPQVEWIRSPGGSALPNELAAVLRAPNAFVIAHEWLDVVPCQVGQLDPEERLRTVLVDPATGAETLGDLMTGDDLAWANENWATSAPGDRVEVGRSRDAAWGSLLSQMHGGLAVAVDYGHIATERPLEGSLAAYASGSLTRPVPDGSCDITAHVAMDTLDADEVHRQRDLLRDLGIRGERPPHELSRSNPVGYLRALERTGAEADLIRPGGFGDFWWAVKHVRV